VKRLELNQLSIIIIIIIIIIIPYPSFVCLSVLSRALYMDAHLIHLDFVISIVITKSNLWNWKLFYSGMWRRELWRRFTEVSEERTASIFRSKSKPSNLQSPLLEPHTQQIVQSVQQMVTGWTTKGSELASRWDQAFSLLHVVQPGPRAHPVSYPMGIGGSFPGGKAAGAWSWPLTSNASN
jgi:hypothetical protein